MCQTFYAVLLFQFMFACAMRLAHIQERENTYMQAEILATGDEIRSGALVDTNSAYIAEKLEETGIAVQRHICAGDDLEVVE